MLLVTFYFRALDQALRWRESGPIGAKCVTGFMIAFILTTRHIRVNKLPFYYRLLFRKRLRVHRSCFGIMEINKELNYEETGNEIGWVHQLDDNDRRNYARNLLYEQVLAVQQVEMQAEQQNGSAEMPQPDDDFFIFVTDTFKQTDETAEVDMYLSDTSRDIE